MITVVLEVDILEVSRWGYPLAALVCVCVCVCVYSLTPLTAHWHNKGGDALEALEVSSGCPFSFLSYYGF